MDIEGCILTLTNKARLVILGHLLVLTNHFTVRARIEDSLGKTT